MSKIPQSLKHLDYVQCVPKGKYLGNFRCHANSLSYSLRHRKKVECIVGVMQVFSDLTGVAHFIVKLKDGTYIDPTYGNLSGILDSYHIPIEEYTIDSFSPNRELENLKNYIFNQLPWYRRILGHNPY